MKGSRTGRLFMVSAVCLLVFSGSAQATQWLNTGLASNQTGTSGQSSPNTSWALGLVVPEGALLADGGKVLWEDVSNVTAAFTLPNISMPDRTVYAVLSVMTDEGAVLQLAAGIRGNESSWFAYSWAIPDAGSAPPVYRWILNASDPEMLPRSNVTFSVFEKSGQWNLRVEDDATRTDVARAFPPDLGSALKAGDQEVFSLESYSKSVTTFREMGNLTLQRLLVDGRKVTGGLYSYGEWDPSHNPLFVVGSSGGNPPAFISLGQAADGSLVWGYEGVWKNGGNPVSEAAVGLAAVLLAIMVVIGLVLWKTKGRNVQERSHELPVLVQKGAPR